MSLKLQTQHSALLSYLSVKVEAADWHGVSDAANDLRVLEAQIALTPMTATEVIVRLAPPSYTPFDWLCSCNCAQACPLGRFGSAPRCTAEELRATLIKLKNPNPEGGR